MAKGTRVELKPDGPDFLRGGTDIDKVASVETE